MEHNTAGAGSFQRRRAGSMRQTAYRGNGRDAGGAKAGPEAGVTLPANEAARTQCEPGLREEWGRGPEKTPSEENGRLEKGTGAALPAGQRKSRAEMSGKARRAAGGAKAGPEAGAALSADEAARKRQTARRTARAAVRIWAARVRRMRDGWPEQEDAIFCPACGCALAQGSLLYFRRGTGACLGCARDVDGHTPFLPACPVCGGALFGDGEAEAPLYTAHGCDFVLGCGRCVAARGAGPLCGE